MCTEKSLRQHYYKISDFDSQLRNVTNTQSQSKNYSINFETRCAADITSHLRSLPPSPQKHRSALRQPRRDHLLHDVARLIRQLLHQHQILF